ncbi:MAG: hypothetical protein JWO42_2540 [Chloroflexi bacterium]|nr:hypothetical protein [Chloroflexota bacterium]
MAGSRNARPSRQGYCWAYTCFSSLAESQMHVPDHAVMKSRSLRRITVRELVPLSAPESAQEVWSIENATWLDRRRMVRSGRHNQHEISDWSYTDHGIVTAVCVCCGLEARIFHRGRGRPGIVNNLERPCALSEMARASTS